MRVGILCERSGTVRDAFLARGHDAVSCDLHPSRRPGPHIQGDCLAQDWRGFDLLIMHPDCTYLTSSGLHWNRRRPERQEHTEAAIRFVLDLMALPVDRLALENPIGCLSTRYRRPDQIIQPWQFGHGECKATCLWLKGLPTLRPTQIVAERRQSCWRDTPGVKNGMDRKERRSVTFQGIADAMADQWGSL